MPCATSASSNSTDFYVKTVAKSPRDYRWSMVLAHIQTNLENYPAAIDTYAKAIAIRPDRTDLLIARAGLEERLMRFDEAASDYERIYQLSYKAPQWMEKVAAVRARQGKTEQTVAALEAALVTGRPENAANYFEVARRLESWGMLPEARSFAEKGISIAGPDLLAVAENHAGAKTYVRIMTRLRQYSQAYEALQKAVSAASANMPVLKEQIESRESRDHRLRVARERAPHAHRDRAQRHDRRTPGDGEHRELLLHAGGAARFRPLCRGQARRHESQ